MHSVQAGRRPKRHVEICRDECVHTAIAWTCGPDLGVVEVDACGCFEDHPGLFGVDAVGAGVVDEEPHAVGREPDVAALAALA